MHNTAHHPRPSAQFLATLCAVLAAVPMVAQCAPVFAPGNGNMGFWSATATASVTSACAWDPDGPGPRSEVLVFAGNFQVAGNIPANGLATFDFVTGTWSGIGAGAPNGAIASLLPQPNGDLIVAGSFTTIGGVAATGVARWDGSTWHPYGTGVSSVYAAVVMPNGNLITVGMGVPQRWNGTTWQPIAASITNGGWIELAVVMANGDLVVAGPVYAIDGVSVPGIARWNGVTWSALPSPGTPPPSAYTSAMSAMPNGDLVVSHNGAQRRFDGTAWTTLGTSPTALSGYMVALQLLANGDLVAAGYGSLPGPGLTHGLFRWNGTTWQPLGGSLQGFASCLALLPWGGLFVGGQFTHAAGARTDSGALLVGTTYLALSRGMAGNVFAVAAAPDSSRIAGGDFSVLGGTACNRVGRQIGDVWHPLGNGVDGDVRAAVVLANGDVVVGGNFQQASGVLVRYVARWNGAAWTQLGSGCNWLVNALAVLPDGSVVAGGEFTTAGGVAASRIARWNGSGWAPLGSGVDNRVLTLLVLANGDLVVGGQFASAGGVPAQNVARWNGSSWSNLGSGVGFVVASLAERPDGTIVAGSIGATGDAAKAWNGSTWTTVATFNGSGSIRALRTLPGGDVVAAGDFAMLSGAPVHNLARWNGTSWAPLLVSGPDAPASALDVAADGTLLVGGEFTTVGDTIAARFARRVPPCPAQGTSYGAGCATTAGTLTVAATRLAWRGSTARFVADHVPATAIAIALTGFTLQSIPLASVHPAGGANCTLLTSPDILTALLPTGNVAQWDVVIPADSALVGVVFHSQLLAAEFDALGLQSLTGSNAITSTIGFL